MGVAVQAGIQLEDSFADGKAHVNLAEAQVCRVCFEKMSARSLL